MGVRAADTTSHRLPAYCRWIDRAQMALSKTAKPETPAQPDGRLARQGARVTPEQAPASGLRPPAVQAPGSKPPVSALPGPKRGSAPAPGAPAANLSAGSAGAPPPSPPGLPVARPKPTRPPAT